jgi:predicted MFS family arabinose efflux permease
MTPTTSSRHSTRGRVMLPLIALAADAFGIGTTEFSPMGLSPEIADTHQCQKSFVGGSVVSQTIEINRLTPNHTEYGPL